MQSAPPHMAAEQQWDSDSQHQGQAGEGSEQALTPVERRRQKRLLRQKKARALQRAAAQVGDLPAGGDTSALSERVPPAAAAGGCLVLNRVAELA